MSDCRPLEGETVIFTGTLKTDVVLKRVKSFGGFPISLPLISVREIVTDSDEHRLTSCDSYDWLIFTSQNAVNAFQSKLDRFSVSVSSIGSKIAAVGSQTAAALEKIGFSVDFIPTVFSADTFVTEFKPTTTKSLKVLFFKGSMAGKLIKEELPFVVDEWTVYATEKSEDKIDLLMTTIQQQKKLSILFASPSAVDVFNNEIAKKIGWNGFRIGAIGHITEKALLEAGATVDVVPKNYTLLDLVNELADQKEGS